MIKLLFSIAIVSRTILCSAQDVNKQNKRADELQWNTLMADAYNLSKSTGKPIFAFFTGSDWCGWCHKLQHDVFAKPHFVDWANKNVILLELDFPRRKKLDPELAKQNNELQQVFNVQGFPTIWMFCLDKDEEAKKINISALGTLGYPTAPEVGKAEETFLANANKIIASCKK
jgi:protein disulfide-isomerase